MLQKHDCIKTNTLYLYVMELIKLQIYTNKQCLFLVHYIKHPSPSMYIIFEKQMNFRKLPYLKIVFNMHPYKKLQKPL